MPRRRILVVEDNQDNMTLIVDVLNSLEYEVFQATDGLRGVEMIQNLRPDLVLMDLSLPKKDGWTVLVGAADSTGTGTNTGTVRPITSN